MNTLFEFLKKFIGGILPNDFTFSMLLTFILNILSIFFLVYPKDFFVLPKEMINDIQMIFNSKVLVFLCTFISIIWLCDRVIVKILKKLEIEVYEGNRHWASNSIFNGFCLYASFYFFSKVIIPNEIKINFDFFYSSFLLIILIMVLFILTNNFFNMLRLFYSSKHEVLTNDNKKRAYLNDFIEIYDYEKCESIEEKLNYYQLLEKTEKFYDKGIRLDEKKIQIKRYQKTIKENENESIKEAHTKVNDPLVLKRNSYKD